MKDDKFLKEVGSRVKAIRMEQGITVRALGKLCKTDYSNLSRFENGQHDIYMCTLKKIAEQLAIDIKDLL